MKVSNTSSISDIKIGLKSGNSRTDFFIIAVIVRDTFLYTQIVVFNPKCRTKFSDYAGKPYHIGISANGEI